MELRPYQKRTLIKVADKLTRQKICLLAGEVRTGKTIISLSVAEKLGCQTVLFLTKKKAIQSILKDAESFTYSLEVLNYESVHKRERKAYDLIICDESHTLGAYPKPSGRTKAVKDIPRGYTLIMSGTPTPESYSQLFHQFQGIGPWKEYTNFYKWAKDFVNVKKKFVSYGSPVNDYTEANQAKIEKDLLPYKETLSQKDAGFVNQINETVLICPMQPITKQLVKALNRDGVIQGKEDVILAETGAKLMQKIHQLCSGTVITESGRALIIDRSKAQFVKDRFQGKRIAIFYLYRQEYNLLKDVFPEHRTTAEGTEPIFIGQVRSSREGLNLSDCEAIIYYNIDFSALSYWQGRDRMTTFERRISEVYWIFSDIGFERKVHRAVSNKMDYTKKHFHNDRKELSS